MIYFQLIAILSQAKLIHKHDMAFKGLWQSYAFVGYTSSEHYNWIKEDSRYRYVGPTIMRVRIPMMQPGDRVSPIPWHYYCCRKNSLGLGRIELGYPLRFVKSNQKNQLI